MRTTPITPNPGSSVAISVSLIRDERRVITVEGMATDSLLMTISSSPGGAPLIEVPGTGQFDLHPAAVQTLTEGTSYHFNIWLRAVSGALTQIAAGMLDVVASIAPTGVDAATTFLSGFGQTGAPDRIVTLTRGQYNALPSKSPTTLYIITGAA